MNKFKKSQVLMLFLLAITPLISSSFRSTYLYFIFNIIIITLGAEAGIFSVFLKPLEETKQSLSVILRPLIPLEAISEKREASTIVSQHVEKRLKLVENSESEKVVSVTKVDKEQKGPSRSSLFFIGKSEASTIVSEHVEKKLKLVENSESDRVVSLSIVDKVQKGPSRSNLSFIGKREASTIVSEYVEKKLKLVENSESERVINSVTLLDKVQKGPSRSSLFFIGNGEDDDAEVMEEETFEAEEEVGGVNGKELFTKAEAFIGLFYKQLKMQREECWTHEKAL